VAGLYNYTVPIGKLTVRQATSSGNISHFYETRSFEGILFATLERLIS